jgi:hypothetical protein
MAPAISDPAEGRVIFSAAKTTSDVGHRGRGSPTGKSAITRVLRPGEFSYSAFSFLALSFLAISL